MLLGEPLLFFFSKAAYMKEKCLWLTCNSLIDSRNYALETLLAVLSSSSSPFSDKGLLDLLVTSSFPRSLKQVLTPSNG